MVGSEGGCARAGRGNSRDIDTLVGVVTAMFAVIVYWLFYFVEIYGLGSPRISY